MARRGTFLCRLIFCAVFSVSIINIFTHSSSPSFFLRYSKPAALPHEPVSCPQSEAADDVLVILRTGATELKQKVPAHLENTLRCIPNFILVSDFEEEINGHAVHNVLEDVSDGVKANDDFKLYRHLQQHGRQGLKYQQAITAQSGSAQGDYLNTDNDGWRLDKWKFLPMVDHALQHTPTAQWYVFIESDTYLVWNNLLEYLSNFDASKPYYIGKHLYINNIEFGYGGAGLILSNPAMQKVSEHRSLPSRTKDYDDFTASHWVGDCALGKVLQDVKVPLHRAFPHLQGDSPATLDPAVSKINRDAWCFPVVTYHHVSPSELAALWQFEQSWSKKHDGLLRHRDVFVEYVRPQIKSTLPQWDNMSNMSKEYTPASYNVDHRLSEIERNAWKSFDKCHSLCETKASCLQFSYKEKSCSISTTFRLGYANSEGKVSSGWMLDRVDDLFLRLESQCGVRDWFSPEGAPTVQRRR